MNSIKISTRLALLISVLCALLIVMGLIGLMGVNQSNVALRSVYEDRTIPVGQLASIQDNLMRNRLSVATSIITPTAQVIAENTAQIEARAADISKTWAAYMATTLTEKEAELAKAFAQDRDRFLNEGLKVAVAALRANQIDEAQRIVTEKIRPLFVPVEKGISALTQLQLDVAAQEYAAAVARYERMRAISLSAIVLGVLFGALLGWKIASSITRPMNQAKDAALRVADGDLTVELQVEGRDETAQLLSALARMRESLSKIVNHVRQNAEGVATASSQIAQGNTDLSSRTEEQASALEQTAASMEELSSTVKQNADNARQANQLALNASEVAEKGGDVVGRVVETMKGINDSSKKIADIISVIDSIAFQTNILALNAAVEAARAGEQGRGFAVVAAEVRNLAQRSADAAKEIKSLITASVERPGARPSATTTSGATAP
ncbi:MAG TPA: methyl-accepting chemotaxis protein, partial [Burkholderiaceae bacterium]|nr:methyl-accepting chemotaxis protein [Burkholderiaceae bacterium]